MAIQEILQLGNPQLYQVSTPVERSELLSLDGVIHNLHDTLMDFRRKSGAGRAIAAPQIGVMRRLIYMNINEPVVFINPQLTELSAEMMTLWDDCMSFPDLLVKVKRHCRCTIRFNDKNWNQVSWELRDDLSELLQHECDHLDGVLAVQRAIDNRSFALRSERSHLD